MPLITGIYYYQIQLLLVKNGINYSQNWLIHLLLMNAIKYWHNDQTHEQLAAAGDIPPHLTVSQLHPPNKAQFRSEKFGKMSTVAFSLLFGN